ncbi:MAG TPA: hypothetical protein VMF29_02335, partial [Candidatus Edwardsbacteria bacterium]|nr:hypothetical protein [Candidatus Edwardsbacteria bacterium]
MKIASPLLIMMIVCSAATAQRTGFEQQTYDKQKLTVTCGNAPCYWKATEGERNLAESEFWKRIGKIGLSRQAARHENDQGLGGARIAGGI